MNTVDQKIPDSLPYGIKGLLDYTWSLPLWVYILLGVVLSLLLMFVVFKVWKYYKNKKIIVLRKTPLELLIEKLKNLVPPPSFSEKESAHYFFELSMLFREIIENITQIPATDLTFKELKPRLRGIVFLSAVKIESIIRFFERAEMIKFADAPTNYEEAQNFHNLILTWTEEFCSFIKNEQEKQNKQDSGVKKAP